MGERKTALITGASVGIGKEFAHILARQHYDVVLVARSRDKLEQLATDLPAKYGIRALAMTADLSAVSSPQHIFDETTKAGLQIDVLVNNAGFGQFGNFVENDLNECLQQIQLNITTLTHLTRLYLPNMVARRGGRVLNVASTAAFQPGPRMAVYYATKSYVLLFSEAIANELRGTGVTVTCLCPGVTTTEFHKRAKMQSARLLKFGAMSAATVAEQGYRGMMTGKPVVIAGFKNWLVAQSVRFAPRKWVTATAGKANEVS